MKRAIALIVKFMPVCFLALALVSCMGNPTVKSDFLLDTFITITIYDGNHSAAYGAIELVRKYDAIFDRHNPDSELAYINASAGVPVTVSRDMADLLRAALYYSAKSGGVYDLTIAPVMDLWDFRSGDSVPPAQEDIDAALMLVNYRNVIIEGDTVTLLNGATIDVGGIAKGFIADRVGQYLRENGVRSAIINLGGDILTVGSRPGAHLLLRGDPFAIGIRDPSSPGAVAGVVRVSDMAVLSSGSYERFFEHDGIRYHHIIDTATGFPVRNDLKSVTVISERAVDGDAISTYLFLLGLEDALAYTQANPEIGAVFITTDGEIHLALDEHRFESRNP